MKQSIWNKRIPTILGLILIVISIGITSFLTGKGTMFTSGAAPSAVPKNVHISNISDTSFTVTYTTDTPTLGFISIGKDRALGLIVFDDRDKGNNIPQLHTIHSFTLNNLASNTAYYFSITSDNTTYMNNGNLFTSMTSLPLTNASSQKIISGTVAFPVNSNTKEVLIYVQPENAQLLSTIVNSQGAYSISLANLRTNDLSNYEQVKDTDNVTVTITDGTLLSHVVTNIANAQKIPAVTLSQDYSFIAEQNSNTALSGNSFGGFPSFGNALLNTLALPAIIVPKKDETFVDQQPLFEGAAMPNAKVTIVIHSDNAIQTQVTADNTGHWTFRPTTPLSPGSHTISITTLDPSGTIQIITQSFTVFPAGTQVFQTATPSATLTPTNSPTPSPQPTATPMTTPSVTPSIQPTITVKTTITPLTTLIETPTPTLTIIIIPSPTRPPLPPTGNALIFPLGIASIITTIVGIGIFVVTQGLL